jgi:hypothetical protein
MHQVAPALLSYAMRNINRYSKNFYIRAIRARLGASQEHNRKFATVLVLSEHIV